MLLSPQSQFAASSTQDSTARSEVEAPKQFSFTPFPNALIDHIMPTLSGSEWQLLCVIIRQTQGWHDPDTGARKTSDWLSHKQLKARTGRGSDAVCHAIESLVRKDHIEVKDEQGRLLATPQERRRNGSRLFYGLGAALHAHFVSPQRPIEALTHHPLRNTRIGKPETTKQTPTKTSDEAFGKSQTSPLQASEPHSQAPKESNAGCGCLLHSQTNQQVAAHFDPETLAVGKDNGDIGRVVAAYQNAIQNRNGPKAKFSTSLNPEQVNRLENALSRYGVDRLLALLEAFFESDLSLIRRRDSSLATFIDSVHILAARRPKDRTFASAP